MESNNTLRLPLIKKKSRYKSTTNLHSLTRSPFLSPISTPKTPISMLSSNKTIDKYLGKKSNDNRASSIDWSNTDSADANLRLDFFQSYKNLPKLTQRNQFKHIENTANLAYLEELEKVHLQPKPFGMIRKEGSESNIDLHMFSMGDRYAEAFSTGLNKIQNVEQLNLKGNRLSQKGANVILSNLENKKTKNLVMADNKLGEESIVKLIELISSVNNTMRNLNLENTKLSDGPIILLCQSLSENNVLVRLILAKNNFGDPSTKAISEMLINNRRLKFLDLH